MTSPSQWHSSFISKQIPGVFSRQYTYVDSAAQKIVVSAINISIAKMYAQLYGLEWFSFLPSHMVMDVVSPEKYYYHDIENNPYVLEWKKRNTFCYQMTFPLTITKTERTKRILQQLNWYFGITTERKLVKRDCWVVKPVGPSHISRKLPSGSTNDKGVTLGQFYYRINQIPNHAPVFKEIDGDRGQLMITDAAYHDLELLRRQLAPYGLTVQVEEREMETLFIKELK